MTQLQLPIVEVGVNDRIAQLLTRCDRIRKASAIDRPTRFDARGQRHAERVADADGASGELGRLGKNDQGTSA